METAKAAKAAKAAKYPFHVTRTPQDTPRLS
jgi:hypothetical protein